MNRRLVQRTAGLGRNGAGELESEATSSAGASPSTRVTEVSVSERAASAVVIGTPAAVAESAAGAAPRTSSPRLNRLASSPPLPPRSLVDAPPTGAVPGSRRVQGDRGGSGSENAPAKARLST